jgi:hypothetical protein
MRKNILNLRKKFESLMDKDEVGGPNDKYQQIANSFSSLSRLWYLLTIGFFLKHNLDLHTLCCCRLINQLSVKIQLKIDFSKIELICEPTQKFDTILIGTNCLKQENFCEHFSM